jgi:hypothetical protein
MMNWIFYRCRPGLDENPQRLPRWEFRNGTVVNAQSYDAAVSIMENVSTKNYWAMETIQGTWDVQFQENICVENIYTTDRHDAVQKARFYLKTDAEMQVLLKKPPEDGYTPFLSTSKYRVQD